MSHSNCVGTYVYKTLTLPKQKPLYTGDTTKYRTTWDLTEQTWFFFFKYQYISCGEIKNVFTFVKIENLQNFSESKKKLSK